MAAELRELERLASRFGPETAARKRTLLERLARTRLRTAAEVVRLHEAACFVRAWADGPAVRRAADVLLQRFARRADLRRHAGALAGSGIVGTRTDFSFFAPTARWLAERWPDRLSVDWEAFDDDARLEALLPLLAHPAESPGLDEIALEPREWIARMKAPRETDAVFLARRFGQLAMDDPAREILYDGLDLPLRLAAGPDTPSRTGDRWRAGALRYQSRPPALERPDLARALSEPPAIRDVNAVEGARLVDLARRAMVARQRDLDVFAYGDPRDVRIADAGDGIQFAIIGALPERRLLLESVYGFLTLRNQVPVGYVLVSALNRSSEIAYNVFETFRGLGAAAVYARVLATTKTLFGSDTFTIFPFQLGEGNDEALASGAWWFYAKLGFAPRDAATMRLVRRERARMTKTPAHRSSLATLRRLARSNLFWPAGRVRPDAIGRIELANVGLAATRYLARRFGFDRARASAACTSEARAQLGLTVLKGWSAGERLAFERWAPLVLLIRAGAWSPAERRSLVAVIRAKGGRRESDFALRFDTHARLRRAIAVLAS